MGTAADRGRVAVGASDPTLIIPVLVPAIALKLLQNSRDMFLPTQCHKVYSLAHRANRADDLRGNGGAFSDDVCGSGDAFDQSIRYTNSRDLVVHIGRHCYRLNGQNTGENGDVEVADARHESSETIGVVYRLCLEKSRSGLYFAFQSGDFLAQIVGAGVHDRANMEIAGLVEWVVH